jgi:AraC-like DNA-binding protein
MLAEKITVSDICRAVNSNASTLNFKFRRETGMSCGEYIMSERMKKARHLLTGSTYNITEIAARCGFDNVYYFSNAFKKIHGVSPINYQKRLH